MLDDYVITVRLPTEDSVAVLGTGYGLNVEAGSTTVWYSDGQDIWLPAAQASAFAMFRGLLRFVPSGRPNLEPPSDTPPPAPPPDAEPSPLLPAMGDCLVLELWAEDYLKLRELVPEPSLVPKRIVYQNVDRDSALRRATELVQNNATHYEKLLREEGERELEPAEVARRARVWLESEWIEGRGVGVYVDPTNVPIAIADIAAPPATAPAGLPAYARIDHGSPAGTSGFRRLTLKALDDQNRLLHPAFLFYLLDQIDSENLHKTWSGDSTFITAQNAAVAELPAVRVAARLEDSESEPVDPDPPSPLPGLRLRIKHASVPIWLAGVFDPFEDPEHGRWRFQSSLPVGDYEDTYDGPPAIAKQDSPRITPPSAITDPFFAEVRFPHWLPFFDPDDGARRRRFVLGVNMETCRRRHYHDLSATDLIFDYYTAGAVDRSGQLEVTYATPARGAAWFNSHVADLREDFVALRAMGVTAIRVWVFEFFEGIRFGFTVPTDATTGRGSPLMLAREAADNGTHPQLRSYVLPEEADPHTATKVVTIQACRRTEFDAIAADWRASSQFNVQPPSNPLFQDLLNNAGELQALAGAHGLRVLWTLMTHYGETKPEVRGHNFIYYTQDRAGSLPNRLASYADWATYYASAPTAGDGRLPIEAWIYRSVIADATLRQSYIENALVPFVEHMENVASGEPLGYEVCNEVDILWDLCSHWWANRLNGDPVEVGAVQRIETGGLGLVYGDYRTGGDLSFPTNWKMTTDELRIYVSECANAIRRTIPAGRDRIVLSGVLGTQDGGQLPWELSLLRPNDPSSSTTVRLTASAFTKYASPEHTLNEQNVWRIPDPTVPLDYGLHTVETLAALTVPGANMLHDNRCLLVEAGDDDDLVGGNSDPERQRRSFRELMSLAIIQGYAGVFVWHYNDPSRVPNFGSTATSTGSLTNHPLTENGAINHESTSFSLNGNIWGRVAVREIQRIAGMLGRLLLPRAPWP